MVRLSDMGGKGDKISLLPQYFIDLSSLWLEMTVTHVRPKARAHHFTMVCSALFKVHCHYPVYGENCPFWITITFSAGDLEVKKGD